VCLPEACSRCLFLIHRRSCLMYGYTRKNLWRVPSSVWYTCSQCDRNYESKTHEGGRQRIQDRVTQHVVCLANRSLMDSAFHVALSETLHSSLTVYSLPIQEQCQCQLVKARLKSSSRETGQAGSNDTYHGRLFFGHRQLIHNMPGKGANLLTSNGSKGGAFLHLHMLLHTSAILMMHT